MKTHSAEYSTYLLSDEWRQKRRQRLKIDNFNCTMCGCKQTRTKRLEIHHLHYGTLGNENVYTDLASLCPQCHARLHHFYDRLRIAPGA
jgi:5-methylcytosine-specific restriction endonuclease McrA